MPDGRPVVDADDAWAAAEELGLPVVIKPRGSDYGRHVALGLKTREEVVAAYEAAAVGQDGVLVERQVPGDSFRLLVVGDRVVAASRRDSTHSAGDGRFLASRSPGSTETPTRRRLHHAAAEGASRGLGPRRRGRSSRRPRRGRGRHHRRRHRPSPGGDGRRRAGGRSEPRPPDVTWSRPRGRPARSPRRSSTPSSRPGKTAGSRSWPSPASTARRPPRAWWPTSSAAPARRSA